MRYPLKLIFARANAIPVANPSFDIMAWSSAYMEISDSDECMDSDECVESEPEAVSQVKGSGHIDRGAVVRMQVDRRLVMETELLRESAKMHSLFSGLGSGNDLGFAGRERDGLLLLG